MKEKVIEEKKDPSQRIYTALSEFGYRFISGKYFNGNDIEVTENQINKYIFDQALENRIKANPTLLDNVKKLFEMLSDTNQLWPELPLIKKAKELGPIKKDSPEIDKQPFPLDAKQYIIINRLLYHRDEEVMFITTGIGGSGKSTFLNIIRQLFNNDAANIALGDLNGFMVAEAVSHRLICSDELGKDDVDGKVLKTLVSGQEINVNPKYGRPFKAKPQAAIFYCCNQAPKIPPLDSGLLRRIYFYERNTKIENPDTSLKEKVFSEEELLWIARRALAYDDLTKDWKEYFLKETHEYIMKNNSVYLCGMKAASYMDYKQACQLKGYKAYSEINYLEVRKLFKEWIGNKDSDKNENALVRRKSKLDEIFNRGNIF